MTKHIHLKTLIKGTRAERTGLFSTRDFSDKKEKKKEEYMWWKRLVEAQFDICLMEMYSRNRYNYFDLDLFSNNFGIIQLNSI